ncbi:argininosuccinate lyase [Achromobacter kerstersii]|jgi:argininosuccinate lyase|uniref:Argininosuccinate lyase n=1 Tax=Achromobacter kerstersii TaxID=1353890 RepID=A0A6S7A1W6_9BURK|nr:argininosuccinate lyase [Achromobacter kerstersii]CAB3708989.1 Argininosuccinate lyase [Achromobacter kerstersii]
MESKVSSRLKQPLAPEVLQYIFLPRLNREFFANFEMLNQINLAHLVMLHEQGILDHDASVELARALLKMQADGPDGIELDPAREEAYFNYEAHLIKLVGQALGGRLHTARSRNDIGATIDRIRARDFATRIATALIGVADAALARAEQYADCVMPGYTHMQAAQPITYGYYLSALVDAWSRDVARLLHALDTADASPLGACALAGTSFPINRDATSAMLGFTQPLANALDGVASRDFALELSAALSIMMITSSRMVQDFYIWSTPEFGYLSFPDSIASTSSIMPQKKNPAVLEYLRGKTGHVIGLTTAAFSTVKSTHFTHSGDSSRESTRTCWEACDESLKALALIQLLVEKVEPNRTRMAARAADDFSTVTDLADLLVRKADASFRDAHHIIGAVVRQALEAGIPAKHITPAMINTAAAEQLGRPVALHEDDIAACLDPVRNVAARESLGGPAPGRVRAHIAEQKGLLDQYRGIIGAGVQRVANAQALLQRRVGKLVSSKPAERSVQEA